MLPQNLMNIQLLYVGILKGNNMPSYLVIQPEYDYEFIGDGRCKEGFNRRIIEASSPLQAILKRIDENNDNLQYIEPEKLRRLVEDCTVLEVVGKAQEYANFENTEEGKAHKAAFEEQQNNERREKELAELKRLQEKYNKQ